MTKSPTIKDLCRGRLAAIPKSDESTRAERIAILSANLQVMREEMGKIPFFYPQSEADVPAWIDQHDRTTGRLLVAIKALAKLPGDTLVPSPFAF